MPPFTAHWSLYVPHSGHYMYRQCNIQQFYVLPTQCIYVFCVDLRTNSDYFPIQLYLTGLYNRDLTIYSPLVTICTTNLTFNNSTFCPQCIYMFCVDLRTNSDYFPIQLYLTLLCNRDLILYSPVVTICTTSLTFNNFTFFPHGVLMCFVWIWEQTAIMLLLRCLLWPIQTIANPSDSWRH